ncbi:hypothetical protein CAPTEDRAFT_195904 [Capitella teleta]|uniref:Ribosome receptor lysine/proline rich domain-containing protein n=1 Tax=Capitella teleta TaxID=283909 RepID=R7TYS2_CAPTE|nr:hypothetical protein CAPTEDRAFT_195904 [Capitella teleta]|eukprot:ELT98869.1 hypothetical protein CAPTEDRAFT_195904 [Capitella teleta]
MEVDTLIIAAGCFVASALVIYLITKCTMQGETFEQVMEEKRRREAMFMSQPKKNAEGKKEKKKKQTKPKAQKKQKEEPVAPQEEIHKMVEIEPDPEIIEPPPEIKPIETPTKKMKSRLKNKNEHSLVREGNVTPELFHPSRTPMDDLEVKHERDRRRSHTEIVEKEVMEEVMKLEAAVQQAAPKSKKNKRKQQAAQPPAEPTPAAEEKPNAVVQSVMTASLTTVEIHTLIDVLHQKLGSTPPAPAQWTKKSQKPDQLAAITKQLEDSQAAHQEGIKYVLFCKKKKINTGCVSATCAVTAFSSVAGGYDARSRCLPTYNHRLSMLKLCSCVNGQAAPQKSRVQETASQLLKYRKEAEQEKSQLRSKQNALEEENTALRNRMQKSTQEHMEVSKQLHQARQQIEEVKKGGNKGQDNAALIQRLQAEIEKLRTERENAKSTGGLQQQIMQQQLESNALSLNAKDSEIRKLQDTKRDTETVLNRKVQELEAELQRSHSRLSNISRDAERLPRAEQELANLRNQMKNLEGAEDQMKSLRQQLQDEQRQKQELQAHNAKMEAHLREVEFGAQEKDQMVQTLQREKSQLANELKESKKVVSEEVVMVKEAALTSSAPPPAQQAEQEAALQRLQGELDSALTEKKRLAADLEAQRKKNNDLREKNWKAMDALSSMEKIAQKSTQLNSDLDTKDSVIRALKDDLHLAKRSLYDLQGSLELSQKSYSGMEKKNADLEAEKQQMNAELSQLAQLRSENETLIAETTQLTTQIEILKTESSSNSDDRIKALEQQIKDMSIRFIEEKNLYAEERKEALEALEVSSASQKDLSDKLQQSQAELQSLLEQANAAKDGAEQAACEQLKQLQEELASRSEANEQLLKQLAELKAQLEKASSDSSSEKEQLEGLQKELSVAKKENADLRRGCEQATLALTQAETAAEEISRVQMQLQQKAEEVSELKQQLSSSQVLAHPSEDHVNEVTVLTRVQESCAWDMRQLVLEVDTKTAEAAIMQAHIADLAEEKARSEAAATQLQQSAAEQSSRLASQEGELEDMRQQYEKEIATLRQQLASHSTREQSLTLSLRDTKKEHERQVLELKARLLSSEASQLPGIAQDQSDIQSLLDNRAASTQEIETQQLQSKIEALSQVENSVDDKVNKALLGEKEKMVAEGKEQAKRTLQKLFPEVDVTETIEESEWITVFEQKVHAFISQKEAAAGSSAETAAQLAEAEQCKNKLECQVEHYKAVLDDTESTLKKLESTIDSEQRKWAERTRVAEEEAAKLKQENQALQANSEGLNDLHFAYQCVEKSLPNIITEMEDKLASMEKRLSSAEQERDTLQDQLNQSNEALGSLKSDLAKTQEDAASAVAKDIKQLKDRSSTDQKKLKDLQAQNIKLAGMLRTGQDALRHEQELVSKLQSQMRKESKGGMPNGSVSSHEVDELKHKLDRMTRQLEQEQLANRQLTAKLYLSTSGVWYSLVSTDV